MKYMNWEHVRQEVFLDFSISRINVIHGTQGLIAAIEIPNTPAPTLSNIHRTLSQPSLWQSPYSQVLRRDCFPIPRIGTKPPEVPRGIE